jgi:hypothetical protein
MKPRLEDQLAAAGSLAPSLWLQGLVVDKAIQCCFANLFHNLIFLLRSFSFKKHVRFFGDTATDSLWTREICQILGTYSEQFELNMLLFDGLKTKQNPKPTNYW